MLCCHKSSHQNHHLDTEQKLSSRKHKSSIDIINILHIVIMVGLVVYLVVKSF